MLRQAVAPLVDLVYPPRCPLCGEGLAAQGGLCPECWLELAIPGRTRLRTLSCRPATARRHRRRIALANLLARLMAARLPQLGGEWLALPVPLHRRLWQRGFNQSALIAGELCKLSGAILLVDGLVRRKPTPVLGGLGRKARARALSGAIAINPRRADRLKGAQVLLVDDVMTSGATSAACVSALKRGGEGSRCLLRPGARRSPGTRRQRISKTPGGWPRAFA